MAASVYQTVGDIIGAVFKDAKESSTTLGLQDQCIRWVQEGQEQVMLRKKRDWANEILRTQASASYEPSSGLSVTNGSAIVTFLSGTFPSTTAGMQLKVNGWDETYDIDSNLAPLQYSLTDNYLGTTNSAATGFVFQSYLVLSSAVNNVYQVTHAFQPTPLTQLGPLDFFTLKAADPSAVGYATHWTIKNGVASNNAIETRLYLWPAPESAYTLNLHYQKYIPELTTINDEPIVPFEFRQALYHYCMAKMYDFRRNETQKSFYVSAFNSWLAKIDSDFVPTSDMPTLKVRYAKPVRGALFSSFDIRNRIDP